MTTQRQRKPKAKPSAGFKAKPAPSSLELIEVVDLDTQPPPMLASRIALGPGRPSTIEGVRGCGKTWLGYDLLIAVAAHLPDAWGGTVPIDRHGRAVILDREMGRHVGPRLHQLAAGRGLDADRLRGRLQVARRPQLTLVHPAAYDVLCRTLDGVALAVIDSRRTWCPGIDHDAATAGEPMDMLAQVSQATGCTIVVIDHDGWRRGRARGSTAIGDACDLQMGIESIPSGLRVRARKVSHGLAWDPIELRLSIAAGRAAIEQRSMGELPDEVVQTAQHQQPSRALEKRVHEYLAAHPGTSANAVYTAVGGSRPRVLELVRLHRAQR